MYIRYFADTSDSALGSAALEYLRGLIRIAPVRLVTLSGAVAGRWCGYEQLLGTPMFGELINCVCCDPSRWIWRHQVPMTDRPVSAGDLAPGDMIAPAVTEVATQTAELYTHGSRNVLFAAVPPRSKAELQTALQYQKIVVPAQDHADAWIGRGASQAVVISLAPSVTDHQTLRSVVCGP